MPAAPAKVIDCLQKSAALHLTAIEHYAALAEHLGRAGYGKLAERYRADADEERGHLRAVQARLEYYQTQPTYQHAAPAWPRYDVPGILAANLTLETATAAAERQHIVEARSVADEFTALVFAELLEGSEQSIKEIEADQFTITQIGIDNWLANQIA